MALDRDFLTGVFEGITDDQAEKVLKEYEASTTGLKVNSDKILAESRGYKEKLEKLNTEYGVKESEFQKQLEEMEAKIKASGADELKKIYEAEKLKFQEAHTAKYSETEKKLIAIEAEKNAIYSDYLKVLMDIEFEKAAEKFPDINPAGKAALRDVFTKRFQFEYTDYEGKKKILRN